MRAGGVNQGGRGTGVTPALPPRAGLRVGFGRGPEPEGVLQQEYGDGEVLYGVEPAGVGPAQLGRRPEDEGRRVDEDDGNQRAFQGESGVAPAGGDRGEAGWAGCVRRFQQGVDAAAQRPPGQGFGLGHSARGGTGIDGGGVQNLDGGDSHRYTRAWRNWALMAAGRRTARGAQGVGHSARGGMGIDGYSGIRATGIRAFGVTTFGLRHSGYDIRAAGIRVAVRAAGGARGGRRVRQKPGGFCPLQK